VDAGAPLRPPAQRLHLRGYLQAILAAVSPSPVEWRMSKVLHILAFFRDRRPQIRRLRGQDVIALLVALIVLFCVYLFIRLADEVKEGDTQTFDEWVLRSLRRADDPQSRSVRPGCVPRRWM